MFIQKQILSIIFLYFFLWFTPWHAEESLVNSAADAPDLPVGPSERTDVTHLAHRGDEVPEEDAPVGRVGADDGVRGAVVEELLVGVEESSLGD